MAAKQREMSDSMHYESRQIREALAASNARLKSARSGRVPADLQPQLGASMLQEWEGLSGTGHLDQDNTLASNNTLYQQMRAALIAFEGEVGYAAPARERAFFAALRTQLMEAGALRDAEQRDMQIAATFKWFSRHKPQGPEADPITAAVLASSLSVEANAAPTQPEMRMSSPGTPLHAATQQQQQPRLPSPPSPSPAGTGNGGGSAAAMPGSYTKHYFFDVYSRAPVGGGTNGSDGTPALPSSSGAGPGLRPTSARGPSPGGRSTGRAEEPPSLSINHPLAMYPSVSAASAARGGTAATASSTADKASPAGPAGPSASASTGGTGQPRARFASTEMFAPAKLVRPQEFDELDHRAAQVAAAAAAAGVSGAAAADGGNVSGGGAARGAGSMHPKPWVSGPHKPTLGGSTAVLGGGGGGSGGGGGAAAAAVRHTSKPGPEELEEVQMLRSKWSEMESKTAKSVADVQAKVAEWTLQRARLEEEIVRRQEAGRIAPLNGSLGQGGHAPPWQLNGFRRAEYEEGPLGPGSLSPYANANADLAAATAAAAAGPGAMNGIMGPTGGLHGAAAAALGASMRQRHADVSTYDRGRPELLRRLNSLGVPVSRDTLDRALRPLEDRPFLDCIARLPKPGDHLVSRPGSVRVPAAKKKRSKSAGKKRPTSGTR
ncbi:hypothetical protein Vafri_4522 [Volvox africanus]|uniref:Uncharacterized protein n=1 Tax=Volvox africanus TaxID=51714 RepID=A0A8J4AY29_9CHLO|nr:hypothetical protein Vafri_4522 [Volvox africanus]